MTAEPSAICTPPPGVDSADTFRSGPSVMPWLPCARSRIICRNCCAVWVPPVTTNGVVFSAMAWGLLERLVGGPPGDGQRGREGLVGRRPADFVVARRQDELIETPGQRDGAAVLAEHRPPARPGVDLHPLPRRERRRDGQRTSAGDMRD